MQRLSQGNLAVIGGAILFPCNDRASYISGTGLYIDSAYPLNLARYGDRPGRSDLRPSE
ncbi:hypothetical protein [Telmatospirillum sp.]|uniref:hypothetical protein n=1 Tax=Telmatospirillum sp. TaxID=2079197 RepID=UPI002843AD1A|nr:hypothetical protein [Telmatospirillum sp.]MDR3435099.1 hypothetical protein [Telmatospirillum sp.]